MAVCLALGMVLPFVTGAIPEVGKLLCPMHIPVFIGSAILGPVWGGVLGFIMPLLRGVMLGSPALFPTGLGMAVELMGYGAAFGLCLRLMRGNTAMLYVSLVAAMLAGRVLGGIAKIFFLTFGVIEKYSLALFFTGYFVGSWLGIVVQLIIIPPIIFALRKLDFLRGLNL